MAKIRVTTKLGLILDIQLEDITNLSKEDYTSMAELGGYVFRLPSRLMITTVLGAQRLLDNETDDWSELIDRPRYEKE